MKQKLFFAFLVMLLSLPFAAARAEEGVTLRALLIGCDHFVSQQGTGEAAETNVHMLAEAISSDARGYALIRSRVSSLATVSDFAYTVDETFMAADADDISLIYISTHGIQGQTADDSGLLLSNGESEELLTIPTLESILRDVPGTKLLILDFCNSGMFIGKGASRGAGSDHFRDASYKVLCSSGADELSWYWQDGQNGTGAGYFATALSSGIGTPGHRPADGNLDGAITLLEGYRFVRENCAVSTPQVYPQEDGAFVFFAYDLTEAPESERTITDLVFDSTLLEAGQSSVAFSFTVHRETALHYQIIYYRDGAWQFGDAEYYADTEGGGIVPPGAKTRNLMLRTDDSMDSGYAILQLITVEGGFPVMQGARIISVTPSYGSIRLSVETEGAFSPMQNEELAISVYHSAPCGLTVTVLDAYGNTVRRLAYASPTRPEQLSGTGSMLYWNGRKADGTLAPEGEYTVQVRTSIGDRVIIAESDVFTLKSGKKTDKPLYKHKIAIDSFSE